MQRRGNVYCNDQIRLGVIKNNTVQFLDPPHNPISHVHHHVEKGADLALYSHAVDIHFD